MAVRNIRTAPSAQAQAAPAPAGRDWALEFTRQQMVVAGEGACALFRGFHAMRGIQEEAARQAAERQAAAMSNLQRATTPLELMTLQADLLRTSVEGAVRYWQQLAAAALEMNTELAGCAAHLVDSEDVLGAARLLDA